MAARMSLRRPTRCNYCDAAAVVWLRKRAWYSSMGHRKAMTIYVSSCADHEGCPNWAGHLSLPGYELERAALAQAEGK